MKLYKQKNTVLSAQDKFGRGRDTTHVPHNITQLGDLAIKLLSEKDLQISQVRPFFWSMVEVYLDRFNTFPFDIKKAVISYLEIKDYPEDATLELINQIESEFEKTHGRPLRKPMQQVCQQETLDDEIQELRDSLKYAAMVDEK